MALLDVGAGWTRESKKGNAYISIVLELDKLEKGLKIDETKVYLVLMENTKKETDKQPDYRLSLQVKEE